MHSPIAHTAEHIFIGSLQRLLQGISVRKVEHADTINRVYLMGPEFDLDIIHKAELMTNQIIEEGRPIKEHSFPSLQEARKNFPQLRANESRIAGEVRVVQVDGYDYSACTREHVKNSSECIFFLITRVTKEGEECEMEFCAGKDAQKAALDLCMKCIRVGKELGASLQTMEATARNLKNDLDHYKKKAVTLTENLVDTFRPENKNGKLVYSKITCMLDESTVMRKAGEIIKNENTVVLITNIDSRATILLACNEKVQLDCNAVLKSVLEKFGGKGGGKRNFANGSVEKEKGEATYHEILKELNCE